MAEVIIEPNDEYDILQNEENEILIALRARMGGVETPRMLYDGQDKILFYRNEDQTIVFDQILPDVAAALMLVDKVLFVEVRDEAIVREYMVPMQKVARIPAVKA